MIRGELVGPSGSIALSELEASFVAYLARRADTVIPKAELLTEVWGYAAKSRSRAVDATLTRVRAKLEGTGIEIESLWGRGLQLTARVTVPREPAPGRLVGRDTERAALQTLLSEPGVVCLWGPPGVGKSALARDLVGVTELQAHGELALEQEVCARLGCTPERLLEELGSTRPTLILDEADSRRPGELELMKSWGRLTSILLVGVQRIEARDDLRLEPLAPVDAARFLCREVGVSEQVAERLAQRTDRLPQQLSLLVEAVRFLGVDAVLEMGAGVFPAMEEEVAGLWSALQPAERDLLAAVSLFHDRFDVLGAARLAEQSPFQVLPVLERLWARSLLQGERGVFRMLAPVRAVASRHRAPQHQERMIAWCRWLLVENAQGGSRWQHHLADLEAMLAVCDDEVAPELGVLLLEHTLHVPDLGPFRGGLVSRRPVILALLVSGLSLCSRHDEAAKLAALISTPSPSAPIELIRRVAAGLVARAFPELDDLASGVSLPLLVAAIAVAGGTGLPLPVDVCERYAVLSEEAGFDAAAAALYTHAGSGARKRGDARWVALARRGGLESRMVVEVRCGDPDRALAIGEALLEVETDHRFRRDLAGMVAVLAHSLGDLDRSRQLRRRFPPSEEAFYLQLAAHLDGEDAVFNDPRKRGWVADGMAGRLEEPGPDDSDTRFLFVWALLRHAAQG